MNNDLLWRFKTPGKKPIGEVKIKSEWGLGFSEENFVVCRNCGNTITSIERVFTIKGQHKHTFINQAGYTYHIGCFSSADGCIVYGIPTLEFTWFEGFSWSFSICSSCLIHLGWYYQSGDKSFFGLRNSEKNKSPKISL